MLTDGFSLTNMGEDFFCIEIFIYLHENIGTALLFPSIPNCVKLALGTWSVALTCAIDPEDGHRPDRQFQKKLFLM